MSADLSTTLGAVPLFSTLEAAELAEFAKLMARQDFTLNQPIVVEGHPPPGLYVILAGKVAVMKSKPDGADHITDLDAGECVGEVEIIDNASCSASVVAYGEVKTAVIIKDNLESFFATHPLAANKILRQMVGILSTRLRRANISYSSLMTIAESVGDDDL